MASRSNLPVGVATQDPRRARAIYVPDKAERVRNYHDGTVAEAMRIMASMGAAEPSELEPTMLRRNLSPSESWSYARLYDWLEPGELLGDAWDAELEPFRHAGDGAPVRWLHKVG